MRISCAIGAGVLLALAPVGVNAQPNPFGDPAVLEAECAAENLESCSKFANYLVTRTSQESKTRAVELNRATCDKGYLPACGDLAASYALGLGVEQDEMRAYEIDLELCEEKDYAPACNSVGYTHSLGKADFAKDNDAAQPYFVRACDLKDASGCQRAGQYWDSYLNPARSEAKAKAFYLRGCDLGDPYACKDLRRLEGN